MINLREYQSRPRQLSDYLPWAALIAPGIILNKDGSLQRTLKYRGPDLESATSEELVSYMARVNNALRRFGSGWSLFFEAARHLATDYPVSSFPNAASWLVDEERRNTFTDAGTHFETSFYLTLCWLPPADRAGRMESVLIDDPAQAPSAFWKDTLNAFRTQTDRSIDLLQSIMPEAEWLSDEATLTYLHACVSAKSHPVRVPETPMCLDAVLTDSPLTGGLSPSLGTSALRTISLQGFPAMTEPGLLRDLDSLGFTYRWTTRFIPLDKTEAEKALTRYRRQWFAKRKSVLTILKETLENEPSPLVNTDADNKASDVDEALQSLGGDYVGFGYLTTAISVLDEDDALADEKARAIERVLNARGFTAINESLNAVDAWLGTHPGNAYANVRQPLVHTLNLAHLAPMAAIWAGPQRNDHLDAPALIMARSSSSTAFRLITHFGDVGHTMIVGPTGAGKSVLLSLMALQFQRYERARVFIFDKGRSARAAMLTMGGADYDLDPSGKLAFQPLARIDQPEDLTFAKDWIIALLNQEGVETDPNRQEQIWSALQNLSEAPIPQRTITGLVALIQDSSLRTALKPYTLEGPFGALLDADQDGLSNSDHAVFEMESLMQVPRLIAPVLAYVFHRLESRFDGAPTLLILDEAWLFLDHPMFSQRLREWLKTLRKKNVSVVFATQSLSDVSTSTIAPTLIESCPTRIFLPNPRACERGQSETYNAFGLNARQIELIAQARPKQDYYLQCPAGNRLFDLELGPIALAFCASGSKQDQRAIDQTLKIAPPGAPFAAHWLQYKSLDWAADLIFENNEGGVACAAE